MNKAESPQTYHPTCRSKTFKDYMIKIWTPKL